MAARLVHLKKRTDFLQIAKAGRKWAMPGLVLQAGSAAAEQEAPRLGLTVSRKVGNAVTRNRAKRRLRALANELLPGHGRADLDYVLIGRAHTPTRAYGALRSDLMTALERVNRDRKAAKSQERGARAVSRGGA
ncbi:MAG: ribonuclease P protein component [Pseudomonadota bacterium]